MCYTSASAAREGAKEALANGTLILLIPPMLFFAAIIVVVYKYRNKFREVSFVRGPLSFDPAMGRWSEDHVEAPGSGFWLPDQPNITPLDELPRTKEHEFATVGRPFPGAR